MKRRGIALRLLVVAGLSAAALTVTASPAYAHGCTPGFFKNHTEVWAGTPYTPDQKVGTVFTGIDSATTANATLLEALQFQGGSGIDGAERVLLRAAVAGLLNAYFGDYGYSLAEFTGIVNFALAQTSREDILFWATIIDEKNNSPEGCPLD